MEPESEPQPRKTFAQLKIIAQEKLKNTIGHTRIILNSLLEDSIADENEIKIMVNIILSEYFDVRFYDYENEFDYDVEEYKQKFEPLMNYIYKNRYNPQKIEQLGIDISNMISDLDHIPENKYYDYIDFRRNDLYEENDYTAEFLIHLKK